MKIIFSFENLKEDFNIKYRLALISLMLFAVSMACVSASDTAQEADDTVSTAIDDVDLSVSDESDTLSNSESAGNFSALASEISSTDEGNTLELTQNYTYNSSTDSSYKSGITISKSITIDGKGYTISGNNAAKIFTVSASNVILKNIKFTSGYQMWGNGGSVCWSGDNGNLINCTFANNKNTIGPGGAVYWGGNNGTITNSTFTNNNAPQGGGVYWNGNNGTVKSSEFENNNATASQGGGIYATKSLNITECYFNNNYAAYGGGSIRILASSNEYITNCTFKNSNTTYITSQYYYPNTFGGAIWVSDGSSYTCYIINSIFENNTATNGSSIYATTNLIIYNSTVNDAENDFTNISKALKATQDLYLSNNTFYNDNVIESIGTISSPTEVTIEASPSTATVGDEITLSGTVTDDNNNPIVLSNLTLTVNDSENVTASFDSAGTFTATYTPSEKGDYEVSAVSDALTSATVNAGSFTVEGGYLSFSTLADIINSTDNDTIYLTENYNYNETIDANYISGILINRTVTIDGQGNKLNGNSLARIFNITAADVVLKNITFLNGNADEGGAVYSTSEITIEDCTFRNNNATDGGAVYSAGGNINNSTFTSNVASDSGGAVYYSARGNITDTAFTDNTAGANGGAVYFEKRSYIINSALTGNTATSNNGGGVYFKKTGDIINCTLTSNTASNNGGGAFFKENTGTVVDSTFTDNSAEKGGAVYVKEYGNVTNSVFTDNSVSKSGAAVYLVSNGTVSSSTFTTNTATKKGGAVYLEFANGTASVSDCTFTGNTAKTSGGAVYVELGEGVVSNSTFTSNKASKNGGAVYYENGGNITDSTFTDNTASGYGSGIYLDDGNHYLQSNTLNDNVIYLNDGTITSKTTATVLNGSTTYYTFGDETVLTGTITDDNDNIIVIASISFLIDDSETVTATINSDGSFSANYTPSTSDDHIVSVNAPTALSDLTIVTGTLSVAKSSFNFTVEVSDAVYPAATITITSIVDGVYNISIGDDIATTITVSDNTGNKTISGISIGTYTVIAMFEGDDNYYSSTANETFTVAKADNTLSVSISDVNYPNQAVASVSASVDGIYTLTVNGADYNVTVSGNTGEVTINLLNANDNEYSAVLAFANSNYTNLENETSFNVNKGSVLPTVTVTSTSGTTAVITVTIGTNATGEVTLTSESNNATSSLENGETTFTLTNLNIGENSISLSYEGDDNYNASSATSTISLSATQPVLVVEAADIYVGETAIINVSFDENITDSVVVIVNGKRYTVAVSEGEGQYNVSDLSANQYTVGVYYDGDEVYLSAENSTEFTVFKLESEATITLPSEINIGDNVTVTVDIPGATGNVSIIVDGVENIVALDEDGTATYTIPEVESGEHSVVAVYLGDETYDPAYNMTTFYLEVYSTQFINLTISGDLTITGVLINALGDAIPNAALTYTVGNVSGNLTTGTDGSFSIDGENNAEVSIDYAGSSIYLGSNITITLDNISQAVKLESEATITLPSEINIGDNVTVTVDIPNATGNVSIIIDGVENIVALDEDGTATYTIPEVESGEHSVVAVYLGDETYDPAYNMTTFYLEVYSTQFINLTVSGDLTITGVLINALGDAIPNAALTYTVGNVSGNLTTGTDGSFSIDGENNAEVSIDYAGSSIYLGSNITISFDGISQVRAGTMFNVTDGYVLKVYAVDYSAGERGAYFDVLLTDTDGNPLINQSVVFGINGWVHNKTTDENGVAHLQINLAAANKYTVAPCYLGNTSYNATFASAMVQVVKKTITISASNKAYKLSATKKYTVKLKTIVGSSADGKKYLKSGKKVTLKINGKTYTAKINANGKATFKITNLSKKATYKAVIKFAGDNTYKAASKTVKITVK